MSSQTLERDYAAGAIALQLEGLHLQKHRCKDKNKANDAPDFDVAVDELTAELENLSTTIQDKKLAISIAKACAMDVHAISEALETERTAQSDREHAMRLVGGQTTTARTDNASGATSTISYSEQFESRETNSVKPGDLESDSDSDDEASHSRTQQT